MIMINHFVKHNLLINIHLKSGNSTVEYQQMIILNNSCIHILRYRMNKLYLLCFILMFELYLFTHTIIVLLLISKVSISLQMRPQTRLLTCYNVINIILQEILQSSYSILIKQIIFHFLRCYSTTEEDTILLNLKIHDISFSG